jgi:hypothetical protein
MPANFTRASFVGNITYAASALDAAPNAQLEQMVSGSKRHESALAGQISARGERPGTYWMLSFGLGFDEARASNIMLGRAGGRGADWKLATTPLHATIRAKTGLCIIIFRRRGQRGDASVFIGIRGHHCPHGPDVRFHWHRRKRCAGILHHFRILYAPDLVYKIYRSWLHSAFLPKSSVATFPHLLGFFDHRWTDLICGLLE